uniref:Uncharacterized protein n=1 Tax=Panagrolaimus sp. PS1159 TaxID=55785 RepID=A0AC35GY40_9BILA
MNSGIVLHNCRASYFRRNGGVGDLSANQKAYLRRKASSLYYPFDSMNQSNVVETRRNRYRRLGTGYRGSDDANTVSVCTKDKTNLAIAIQAIACCAIVYGMAKLGT